MVGQEAGLPDHPHPVADHASQARHQAKTARSFGATDVPPDRTSGHLDHRSKRGPRPPRPAIRNVPPRQDTSRRRTGHHQVNAPISAVRRTIVIPTSRHRGDVPYRTHRPHPPLRGRPVGPDGADDWPSSPPFSLSYSPASSSTWTVHSTGSTPSPTIPDVSPTPQGSTGYSSAPTRVAG